MLSALQLLWVSMPEDPAPHQGSTWGTTLRVVEMVEGEVVEVGEVEEEEEEVVVEVVVELEERPLGRGREEARCCSRRRRCWRKVEERSRASALRLEADRLASRALAWLEEAVREDSAPSWGYFLRPGANTVEAELEEDRRPEKLAALVPDRRGSILLLLFPWAYGSDPGTDQEEEEQEEEHGELGKIGKVSGGKRENEKREYSHIVGSGPRQHPSIHTDMPTHKHTEHTHQGEGGRYLVHCGVNVGHERVQESETANTHVKPTEGRGAKGRGLGVEGDGVGVRCSSVVRWLVLRRSLERTGTGHRLVPHSLCRVRGHRGAGGGAGRVVQDGPGGSHR